MYKPAEFKLLETTPVNTIMDNMAFIKGKRRATYEKALQHARQKLWNRYYLKVGTHPGTIYLVLTPKGQISFGRGDRIRICNEHAGKSTDPRVHTWNEGFIDEPRWTEVYIEKTVDAPAWFVSLI